MKRLLALMLLAASVALVSFLGHHHVTYTITVGDNCTTNSKIPHCRSKNLKDSVMTFISSIHVYIVK